jgi:hypothetical protein
MSNLNRCTPNKRSDARYPPTVDLQGTKIIRAIAVTNFSANPARFLITQSPKRFLEPVLTKRGLPNTGGDPHVPLVRRLRKVTTHPLANAVGV